MELGFHDRTLLHREGEAWDAFFYHVGDGDALIDLIIELVAHHSEVDWGAVAFVVLHEVVIVAVHALPGLEIDILHATFLLVDVELDIGCGPLNPEGALHPIGERTMKVKVHCLLPLDRDAYRSGVGRASAFLGNEHLCDSAVLARGVAVGCVAVGEVDASLALELLIELLDDLVL